MVWKNLGLSKKIAFSMGTMVIIICSMAFLFIRATSSISGEMNELQQVEGMSTTMLQREIDHLVWISSLQRFVYDESQSNLTIQQDGAKCNLGKWYYGDERKIAEQSFPALKTVLNNLEEPHLALHKSAGAIQKLRSEGKDKEAVDHFETVTMPNLAIVQKNLDTVINDMQTAKKNTITSFSSLIDLASATTYVSAAIGLVLALIMSLLIAKSITKPTIALARYADLVAAGDYKVKSDISRGDELGRLAKSIEIMVDNMVATIARADEKTSEAEASSQKAQEAVLRAEEAQREAAGATQRGMRDAAARLESIVADTMAACHSLSASMATAADGTEEQRRHATETVTAMTQMTGAVLEIAKNASSASENADLAKGNAGEGASIVQNTLKAIEEVRQQTLVMTETMGALGKQAEGVSQVMSVISDVADQTNLLALNAAIEAARAGEAGRGFAVVADEVRKLAERTMQATQEVGQVIRGIQESAKENIAAMTQTAKVVEQSNELAHNAGTCLAQIVEIVSDTAGQVQSIAAASEEQSATSEQINRSTEEINRLAVENSSLMEQAGSSVADLENLTKHISDLVEELKRA